MNSSIFGSKTRRIGALAALAVLLRVGIIAGQRWVTEAHDAMPQTPPLSSTHTGIQIVPVSDDHLLSWTFYAVDWWPDGGSDLVRGTTTSSTVTRIPSPDVGEIFFAGDFAGTDYTKLYAVGSGYENFYSIDTATGAKTLIGTMEGPRGQDSGWT